MLRMYTRDAARCSTGERDMYNRPPRGLPIVFIGVVYRTQLDQV